MQLRLRLGSKQARQQSSALEASGNSICPSRVAPTPNAPGSLFARGQAVLVSVTVLVLVLVVVVWVTTRLVMVFTTVVACVQD